MTTKMMVRSNIPQVDTVNYLRPRKAGTGYSHPGVDNICGFSTAKQLLPLNLQATTKVGSINMLKAPKCVVFAYLEP